MRVCVNGNIKFSYFQISQLFVGLKTIFMEQASLEIIISFLKVFSWDCSFKSFNTKSRLFGMSNLKMYFNYEYIWIENIFKLGI